MSQTTSPNMLQYLDVLLKHGNFTKASKELYISQPYLTQLIKKVEHDLGAAIINRQAEPLSLTEAGKLYYQYLETLEKEADLLQRNLAKYNTAHHATLRIGVLSSLGTYLLPKILPLFKTKQPDVRIILDENLPKENERKLLANEIDFYLGQNPETVLPKLKTYPCGKDSYFAIISNQSSFFEPAKFLLAPGTIPMKELLQSELVLTTSGSAVRRQVDQLLQRYKVTPTIIAESPNIYTVASLAKNGYGLTIVPESVTQTTGNGLYNLYPISDELISLRFFIAVNASRTLSNIEQEFIETVIQSLA